MAVQSYGQINDGKGHEKSYAAFKRAHEENTRALLNLAEGKSEEEERPRYDPSHPDNTWPLMVHHPGLGELTVGKTLKGVVEPAARREIIETNHAEKKAALKQGYRLEPYLKPQIAVLDPAAEKAAMVKERDEMKGQLAVLQDMLTKLMAAQAAQPDKTAQ